MEIGQVGTSALPSATSGNASVAENPAVTNRVPGRAAEALGVKPAAIEPRRQALSILRQEIRQVLQSSFRIKFAASAPGYVDPGRVDAGAVTGDALNGAAAAAQRSPLKAARIDGSRVVITDSTHRDHFVQTIVIRLSSDRDRSEATSGTSVL